MSEKKERITLRQVYSRWNPETRTSIYKYKVKSVTNSIEWEVRQELNTVQVHELCARHNLTVTIIGE